MSRITLCCVTLRCNWDCGKTSDKKLTNGPAPAHMCQCDQLHINLLDDPIRMTVCVRIVRLPRATAGTDTAAAIAIRPAASPPTENRDESMLMLSLLKVSQLTLHPSLASLRLEALRSSFLREGLDSLCTVCWAAVGRTHKVRAFLWFSLPGQRPWIDLTKQKQASHPLHEKRTWHFLLLDFGRAFSA